MHQLRPIDEWFVDTILPHEAAFLARANKLARDRQDARDLLHDVYARVMQLDGWQAIDSPRAYIMRMLQNLAVERVRRARLVRFEQLAELGSLDPADPAPDAFCVVDGRQRLERVRAALARLPDRNREAVVLRRFAGHSPREAAMLLGISLSTFEKRLARSLALLAAALEPEGPTAPGAAQDDPERGNRRETA